MWKQFRQNPGQALDHYMKALSLGYTVPLKELYAAAGIRFDFSPAYVKTLIGFVQQEMEKLVN
jgi:oligoendopeptidase F